MTSIVSLHKLLGAADTLREAPAPSVPPRASLSESMKCLGCMRNGTLGLGLLQASLCDDAVLGGDCQRGMRLCIATRWMPQVVGLCEVFKCILRLDTISPVGSASSVQWFSHVCCMLCISHPFRHALRDWDALQRTMIMLTELGAKGSCNLLQMQAANSNLTVNLCLQAMLCLWGS